MHGSPPGPGAKVDFSESRFRSKRLSDCKADASRCSEMHSFAFLAPCIAPSILAPWLREEREICNGRSNKGHYRKCGSQTFGVGGRLLGAFIWEVWEMSSHISGRSRMSLGCLVAILAPACGAKSRGGGCGGRLWQVAVVSGCSRVAVAGCCDAKSPGGGCA